MGRELRLTSPHMHGPDVRELQHQLDRRGWYDAKIDGEYGPYTAQAVYRAKFWLGWPYPNQVAGDKLVNHLTHPLVYPLPLLYRTIAKRRLNRVNNVGYRTLREAIRHLGVKENPPRSNRTMFGTWYGVYCPWCMIFVSYCGVKAGSTVFSRGRRYSYVPTFLSDARAGRNHLTLTVNPRSGDMPCYDWDDDYVPDHVGIYAEENDLRELCPDELRLAIKEVGRLGAGQFWAVEGNTAYGNDSNGGAVMIRKRNKSDVRGFVRIGR